MNTVAERSGYSGSPWEGSLPRKAGMAARSSTQARVASAGFPTSGQPR